MYSAIPLFIRVRHNTTREEMVPSKTLKPHTISSFLRHQIHVSQRRLTTTTQGLPPGPETNAPETKKQPSTNSLSVLFRAAVGITENTQCNSTITLQDEQVDQVQKTLTKIEEEVRSVKGMNSSKKNNKPVGLYSLFTYEPRKLHPMFCPLEEVNKTMESKKKDEKLKEGLSDEMVLFVKKCLYENGYLKDANFLLRGELVLDRLSTDYARGYLRSAAEKFGKDHEELAKCLSENDLKRLALFGCPDASHKTTYAAKRLRSYFSIQELLVCRACKLKSLCKYKFDTDTKKINELNIVDVMRILTLYSLELVPPELTLPDEVKDSTSKLLTQVVAYCQ